MKFRTISYYLGEAFRNMVRNRLMSIASILTVASCIFIVSVFYCVAANVDFFLNQLEGSMQITVFLREDLSTEEVQLVLDKILAVPYVTGAKYVPSQQSLDDFAQTLDDPRILAGLERDNPFRRSFDIDIVNLVHHDEVILALEALEPFGISRISHAKEVVDMVRAVSNIVRVISLMLILILGILSIVIITNTIPITVNARKAEINIMKYVGATDWFIRWPFAIEGVFIGLIGGILPALLVWAGYTGVIERIKQGLPVIGFIQFMEGNEIFSYLFPFAVLLGMVIGLTGSSLSIRKHLKV